MNKKILTGLSVFALVAGFWACGDGSVEALNDDDMTVKGFLDDSEVGSKDSTSSGSSFFKPEDVEAAKQACLADEACNKAMSAASGAEVVPTSEASIPTAYSSANQTNPGSSSQKGPVINLSSATITPVGGSSSSTAGGNQTTTSSSSEEIVSNGDPDGSCSLSPTTGALQKGEKATWTFAKAPWSGDMIADYEGYKAYNSSFETIDCVWTLTGSDEKTTTVKCSETSVTATYQSIGSYTAKIKVGNKEPHDCTGSIKVQGLPVTGCVCTAPQTVDIATNPEATWSVACASTNETITGYEWTDADGNGPSAKYTFTAPKQTRTPKVKVSTAESDTTVTCASPQKVYDSEHIDETMSWTNGAKLEPGFYTLTDCASATGEKTVQVTSGSATDCNTWFGATSWSGGPWNTCSGQFKVSFPLTMEVPEGEWVTLNSCW